MHDDSLLQVNGTVQFILSDGGVSGELLCFRGITLNKDLGLLRVDRQQHLTEIRFSGTLGCQSESARLLFVRDGPGGVVDGRARAARQLLAHQHLSLVANHYCCALFDV